MEVNDNYLKEIQRLLNKNSEKIKDTVFSLDFKLNQKLSRESQNLLKKYIQRLNTKSISPVGHAIFNGRNLTIGFNSHSGLDIYESFKELVEILNMPETHMNDKLVKKLSSIRKYKKNVQRNCALILNQSFI